MMISACFDTAKGMFAKLGHPVKFMYIYISCVTETTNVLNAPPRRFTSHGVVTGVAVWWSHVTFNCRKEYSIFLLSAFSSRVTLTFVPTGMNEPLLCSGSRSGLWQWWIRRHTAITLGNVHNKLGDKNWNITSLWMSTAFVDCDLLGWNVV
jgi:hypothetical protein